MKGKGKNARLTELTEKDLIQVFCELEIKVQDRLGLEMELVALCNEGIDLILRNNNKIGAYIKDSKSR